MKRLMILTVMAMLTIAMAGCCRAWPRWWWYRGDPCDPCGNYQSQPMLNGGLLAPPSTETPVLPGPAAVESST